jgi:hypothetical protein
MGKHCHPSWLDLEKTSGIKAWLETQKTSPEIVL